MSRNETSIHPTSIVHPKARLDTSVSIGPYSFIGENVSIHKNTHIDGNVFITGHTEIGEGCRFSPFTSIGTEPQDIGYDQEKTFVKIGNRNIFREFVTVHRGTVKGRAKTTIGNDNYFMAYSHVAHDCIIGNEVQFVHGATVGGHVLVEDFSAVGAYTGVHQFCRIGEHAFIGGYSVITQDVFPFSKVAGNRPPLFLGLNAVGLRRRGFSRQRIASIKEIFRIFFYMDLNATQALEKIEKECPQGEDRDIITRFIRSSKRGVVKKVAEKWEHELE
jgi:UDP-N-acetylglucosamine acyltransferase